MMDRKRATLILFRPARPDWRSKQSTYMTGNTNKGSSVNRWVSWLDEGQQSPPWDYRASHLVVCVKLAAVDVVVVAPEHRDQFSCVEGIHSDWAAAWHKHKLRAAATGHCELEPFTTLVADLPVIYLEDKQWRHINFRSCVYVQI